MGEKIFNLDDGDDEYGKKTTASFRNAATVTRAPAFDVLAA